MTTISSLDASVRGGFSLPVDTGFDLSLGSASASSGGGSVSGSVSGAPLVTAQAGGSAQTVPIPGMPAGFELRAAPGEDGYLDLSVVRLSDGASRDIGRAQTVAPDVVDVHYDAVRREVAGLGGDASRIPPTPPADFEITVTGEPREVRVNVFDIGAAAQSNWGVVGDALNGGADLLGRFFDWATGGELGESTEAQKKAPLLVDYMTRGLGWPVDAAGNVEIPDTRQGGRDFALAVAVGHSPGAHDGGLNGVTQISDAELRQAGFGEEFIEGYNEQARTLTVQVVRNAIDNLLPGPDAPRAGGTTGPRTTGVDGPPGSTGTRPVRDLTTTTPGGGVDMDLSVGTPGTTGRPGTQNRSEPQDFPNGAAGSNSGSGGLGDDDLPPQNNIEGYNPIEYHRARENLETRMSDFVRDPHPAPDSFMEGLNNAIIAQMRKPAFLGDRVIRIVNNGESYGMGNNFVDLPPGMIANLKLSVNGSGKVQIEPISGGNTSVFRIQPDGTVENIPVGYGGPTELRPGDTISIGGQPEQGSIYFTVPDSLFLPR